MDVEEEPTLALLLLRLMTLREIWKLDWNTAEFHNYPITAVAVFSGSRKGASCLHAGFSLPAMSHDRFPMWIVPFPSEIKISYTSFWWQVILHKSLCGLYHKCLDFSCLTNHLLPIQKSSRYKMSPKGHFFLVSVRFRKKEKKKKTKEKTTQGRRKAGSAIGQK